MKNLKNIFTVALIATCMSGCTGFLDIEPETTLTGKNFYKSPDDIRSALYSTYSSLRDNGLYSASIYLFGDVRSDVAFPNQTNYYANTFRHEIEKFTISANNSGNQNYWAHHYKGIIRANTVIEKGKELFGNDETVQKYIAEAEVLRALFYFNLVRAYGGVPIIMDIPQEYTDSRGHLRASAEEVYIRILTDLTSAIESNNLYRSTNSGEKTPTGRVDKYVAEALLGKVLLSMPNDITEAAYPDVETWKDISINPNITVFYPKTTTTQYEAAKYYLEDYKDAIVYLETALAVKLEETESILNQRLDMQIGLANAYEQLGDEQKRDYYLNLAEKRVRELQQELNRLKLREVEKQQSDFE